jgi:hypothetical protein
MLDQHDSGLKQLENHDSVTFLNEDLGFPKSQTENSEFSFTQRINQNYTTFLLMTPEALKQRGYTDDNESDQNESPRTRSKKRTNEKKLKFWDINSLIQNDNIARTLNFMASDMKVGKPSNPSDPYFDMAFNMEELLASLLSPTIELCKEMQGAWDFYALGNDLGT